MPEKEGKVRFDIVNSYFHDHRAVSKGKCRRLCTKAAWPKKRYAWRGRFADWAIAYLAGCAAVAATLITVLVIVPIVPATVAVAVVGWTIVAIPIAAAGIFFFAHALSQGRCRSRSMRPRSVRVSADVETGPCRSIQRFFIPLRVIFAEEGIRVSRVESDQSQKPP